MLKLEDLLGLKKKKSQEMGISRSLGAIGGEGILKWRARI